MCRTGPLTLPLPSQREGLFLTAPGPARLPRAPRGLCRQQHGKGWEGLSADICPASSRGLSSRNTGPSRIMRNRSSVLFTAPKDIFFLLEAPQGGCFSWLLGKRGAPQGIARPGVRRLGAARRHIKGSQGHQKRSLATSMSEGRAAGTSSGSGM